MGAERVAFVVSYRSNDLVRVVTLHATVMASGSLAYLVGCGMKADHSHIQTRLKRDCFQNWTNDAAC